MSSFHMRPMWADEFPEFYQALKRGDGELDHVDEFDVPFWSGVSYVSLKASHPIFRSKRGVRGARETDALDEVLESWDDINDCEQRRCQDTVWRALLLKQPRKFTKETYQKAKSIFLREQTTSPFLIQHM